MSTKSTLVLTNDHDEHIYKDCSEVYGAEGFDYAKSAITVELNSKNVRVEVDDSEGLVFTLINPDSEIYKIFEQIGKLATKEQR